MLRALTRRSALDPGRAISLSSLAAKCSISGRYLFTSQGCVLANGSAITVRIRTRFPSSAALLLPSTIRYSHSSSPAFLVSDDENPTAPTRQHAEDAAKQTIVSDTVLSAAQTGDTEQVFRPR
jgi:hypothetical protein